MHPYDMFDLQDKHYNALYTMLFALRGYRPIQSTVEAKFVSMILSKRRTVVDVNP